MMILPAFVAQSVEQLTLNQLVDGSNPPEGTILSRAGFSSAAFFVRSCLRGQGPRRRPRITTAAWKSRVLMRGPWPRKKSRTGKPVRLKHGALGRIRTVDQLIKSQLLYRLSYEGDDIHRLVPSGGFEPSTN